MNRFVLLPNPQKDAGLAVTARIASLLHGAGATVYLDETIGEGIPGALSYKKFPVDAEAILVIGGDGSVLDASVLAVRYDIPLLGVNLGRVGYLSEVEPEDPQVLLRLLSGEYTVKEERLLTVATEEDGHLRVADRYAVNDIIVTHDTLVGMADITVADSRGESVRYRADGVIVATPAGSTAYSLSAGGPIVAHGVDTILVTPVCAHSFFNRSILFSSEEEIRISNNGRGDLQVNTDGRFFASLAPGAFCTVKCADRRLKIITLQENSMFRNLFRKMRILEDI